MRVYVITYIHIYIHVHIIIYKYFIILTLEGALYITTQINLLILHVRKEQLKILFH